MNTFKHKSLYAALAGLGALGATGVAQAVSVNHDGLGQVLIYPYYTVRSTIPIRRLPVHLTPPTTRCCRSSTRPPRRRPSRSASSKARTAAKSSTSTCTCRRRTSGLPRSSRPRMAPASSRRTSPARPRACRRARASPTPFVNFAYSGSNDDKAGTSLDRTREGYVEIIEMGDVIGADRRRRHPRQRRSALHGRCAAARSRSADTVPGTGGLFGSMTLINVLKGEDFGIDPDGARRLLDARRCGSTPGDITPTLADVNPKTSVVVAGSNVYITDWSTCRRNTGRPGLRGPDAQQRVQRVRAGRRAPSRAPTGSSTFPTKRDYVFARLRRGAEALPEQLHGDRRVRRRRAHAVRPRRAHDHLADVLLAAAARRRRTRCAGKRT